MLVGGWGFGDGGGGCISDPAQRQTACYRVASATELEEGSAYAHMARVVRPRSHTGPFKEKALLLRDAEGMTWNKDVLKYS